ncbi:bifunctional diguanylate cyclase/phosphodiesterase [Rhodanobacter sp. DHB23]|uniref:putative bifunctional diguanylate cyclase/phosphodiesterase n=1 Tax=Rhodanobacter sp. DHB23 TaxID=2775923 RepID=UPI001CE1AA59|nr:bifunctional diguanylate cyclase/phosphodiesterase [Rhodanobacter sp. DHB23]
MASSYNPLLVVCSLLVAIFASYTALHMAGRITTARDSDARRWLLAGAGAMGLGIWSMHFIGMLAFSLPIPLGYDPAITLLSLLIAIASSAFALWLVCRQTLPWMHLVGGALLMGPAIAGMHYTGMAAMRMTPGIQYDAWLFALSVAIAIVASGAALWIAFQLRKNTLRVRRKQLGAAVVMGLAIVGMHYTGMSAAQFPLGSICGAAHQGVNTDWLAVVVIVVTLAVLAMTLTVSVLDFRMRSRTAVLVGSLAEANEELSYLALHDSQTKLPNRVLLHDRLEREIQAANRDKGRFALMFLDLDGFKAVNDVFGHRAGDLLLVEIAQRIRANVGDEDTVARIGGDEFVLLARIGEPADAARTAETLMKVIGEPIFVAKHELHVTCSIGIALYPGSGATQQELMTNADAAMYHAKASGRKGYVFFEASMNSDAHEQMQIARELRMAQARGELALYYQPKFDAPNGPVIGAEALLRWSHPTLGMIPPSHFIPIAEKSGQIVPIGEWVLDEACRQMRAWHDAGHPEWTIAVNLSAVQFGHDGLIEMVRDTLERHALAPRFLTLEITESTAMSDVEASLATLRQLKDMGVNISIDDFGTGYSSLLYLKRLPATELKIDKGFVRDLAAGTEDAAIVSAIVALGQTLNLKIVAEGVETAAQKAFLTRIGCDSLQGFMLGQPMPAKDFIEAVAQDPASTEARE